jgi:hypothetical protein
MPFPYELLYPELSPHLRVTTNMDGICSDVLPHAAIQRSSAAQKRYLRFYGHVLQIRARFSSAKVDTL